MGTVTDVLQSCGIILYFQGSFVILEIIVLPALLIYLIMPGDITPWPALPSFVFWMAIAIYVSVISVSCSS